MKQWRIADYPPRSSDAEIAWQKISDWLAGRRLAYQPIADCPPRDFRVRKTLSIMNVSHGEEAYIEVIKLKAATTRFAGPWWGVLPERIHMHIISTKACTLDVLQCLVPVIKLEGCCRPQHGLNLGRVNLEYQLFNVVERTVSYDVTKARPLGEINVDLQHIDYALNEPNIHILC